MRRRADPENHGDHAGTHTLALDPIARPAASSTVEVGRRASDLAAHARRGYGNGGPVEITKRFPPDLGNLAQNARFPHFHSRLHFEEEKRTQTNEQGDDPVWSIAAGHSSTVTAR